jgi:hypothetical protein
VDGVRSIIAVAVAATNVGATRLAGRARSVSPPSSGSSAELASPVSLSSTARVASSDRFRLAARAFAAASVEVV